MASQSEGLSFKFCKTFPMGSFALRTFLSILLFLSDVFMIGAEPQPKKLHLRMYILVTRDIIVKTEFVVKMFT